MDVDARMQLFDLRTKYQFQTRPGINHYNMPLYNTNGYPIQVEPGNQTISYYPVYQGFMQPAFVNGIQIPFYNDRSSFYNIWPQYTQALNNSFFGDGINSSYTVTLPNFPALAGYVDITGIIAANSPIDPIVATTLNEDVPITSVYPAVFITTQDANNNTIVVNDSGQFLEATGVTGNMQLGMLTGNVFPAWGTSTNVVNYVTGEVNVSFADSNGVPLIIPADVPINIQCYFFQQGIPRAVLYYNNCISIMPPPDVSYLVELDAYLSPAAFLSTGASIPFAYMCEYLARGAARKILSDTGDVEQFVFYEPLFKEQESLVWKRSQRQFTTTRTGTIFSEYSSQSPSNNYAGGGN